MNPPELFRLKLGKGPKNYIYEVQRIFYEILMGDVDRADLATY